LVKPAHLGKGFRDRLGLREKLGLQVLSGQRERKAKLGHLEQRATKAIRERQHLPLPLHFGNSTVRLESPLADNANQGSI
jgi:hypothetical protein